MKQITKKIQYETIEIKFLKGRQWTIFRDKDKKVTTVIMEEQELKGLKG